MARAPRLKLALLAAAVVVAHVLGLEWFGRQADAISGLSGFVPPMYTRMLKPATPPPVVHVASAQPAQPKPRVAPMPRPPASSPEEIRRKKEQQEARAQRARERRERERLEREKREREEALAAAQAALDAQPLPEPEPEPEPPPAVAEAAAPAASAPQGAASAAQPAASAASAPTQVASAATPPASAASQPADATASLDRWPVDTRLNYRLNGQWRTGPLFGDARVQWQREGSKYQVRLDVKIQVFGTQVLTSQGEVTPDGLLPRVYEELRPGKRRVAQLGDQVVTLENGTTIKRPPGVQDTASQFVELSQRFATGKDVLEVGRAVTVWLARPGGLDQWTYDIVGREMIRTRMGDVEAFHLKPRMPAEPRGNITAEMWFAPSLQYLPVRIKVIMGTEAYLDLTVDDIQQR